MFSSFKLIVPITGQQWQRGKITRTYEHENTPVNGAISGLNLKKIGLQFIFKHRVNPPPGCFKIGVDFTLVHLAASVALVCDCVAVVMRFNFKIRHNPANPLPEILWP